ncbi:MAG: hypothetical protein GTO55_01380, partial [Armatimonadetes bacterium]|nr:hypothetical protein [Armatimonadota bacterium]NIM22929.1 hypothetical protein [Armatimonadota bacterium]NIM66800.1 hypothetical protein [Armatimonadota bacterium]NIN04988.1 hypothetical protein [Armatimonadota bacterium]NIO96034.1 hypothetical protein [Armatimonadota bacterium]
MVEKKRVFYIRRAIFLLIAVAVAIPLLTRIEFPMIVGWPAQNLYDFVDKVPPDKIVVVSTSWSAGSQGECAPQTAALIRHLAKSGKRFAIWSFSDIQGPELAQAIAEPVTKEYDREYGVDWVNWGYKTGASAMIRGWAKDIWGTVKEDIKGTPAEELPFMENVRSHEDIGLIVDISAGVLAGTNTVNYYIQFLKGLYNVPVGYACTGVMAPEAFPYLDSGQIVGMMRGLAGAAEYEALVGFSGDATRRMTAQSFAHVLIIALIIIGNAGYFLS